GIGVFDGGDDASDPGADDPPHAGAGPADVTAGLEGAEHGRPAGARAGHLERIDFRVRLAGAFVVALTDDQAVGRHDDGAYHRVGARASASARGEKKGPIHVIRWREHRHHSLLCGGAPPPPPVAARSLARRVACGNRPRYQRSSNKPSTYSSAEKGT